MRNEDEFEEIYIQGKTVARLETLPVVIYEKSGRPGRACDSRQNERRVLNDLLSLLRLEICASILKNRGDTLQAPGFGCVRCQE